MIAEFCLLNFYACGFVLMGNTKNNNINMNSLVFVP